MTSHSVAGRMATPTAKTDSFFCRSGVVGASVRSTVLGEPSPLRGTKRKERRGASDASTSPGWLHSCQKHDCKPETPQFEVAKHVRGTCPSLIRQTFAKTRHSRDRVNSPLLHSAYSRGTVIPAKAGIQRNVRISDSS